jgi:hypothetical protein
MSPRFGALGAQPLDGGVPVKLRDVGVAAGARLNLVAATYSEFEGQCQIVGAARDGHGNAAGSCVRLAVCSGFSLCR